jgi:Cu(I)/Ag(I) efflux system membrane fusion protein
VLPRPGTAAEVQLLVGQKENALLVPARAVARVGSERLVVVLGGAKPEARPVKLGLRTEDIVEVLEGVREGEQVISPAPQSLLTPQRLDSAIPTAVPIPIPSRQVPVRG